MKVAIIYLGSNNLLSLTSVLDFLAVKYEVVKKKKILMDLLTLFYLVLEIMISL